MKKRIKSIKLDTFKGATQPFSLEFDTNKPIAMIFGENGTGKSTIVDSLDFVFNENLQYIEDKKIGKSKHKYIHSINSSPDKLKIEVNIHDKTSTGKITNKGEKIINRDDDCPTIEILRRNQILNIVNADPKDKFAEIKKFIDVSKCQDNENSLRSAKITLKKEYDEATLLFNSTDAQLKNIWEQEGAPGKNYLSWANEQVKLDYTEIENYINAADKIIKQLELTDSSKKDVDTKSLEYKKIKNDYEKSLVEYE